MTATKYDYAKNELEKYGQTSMKVFGQSMMPILKSGSTVTFIAQSKYEVGDFVFCKCRGRIIDCHKIVAVDLVKGYLIANNSGFQNGWAKIVYGKAVEASINDKIYWTA